MANTKKLTHKDYYNMLLAIDEVAENEALVGFINGRIEQIDKKASGTSKADEKKNAENEDHSRSRLYCTCYRAWIFLRTHYEDAGDRREWKRDDGYRY